MPRITPGIVNGQLCHSPVSAFTGAVLGQIISKPISYTLYIEAQRLRYSDYKLDLGVGEDQWGWCFNWQKKYGVQVGEGNASQMKVPACEEGMG